MTPDRQRNRKDEMTQNQMPEEVKMALGRMFQMMMRKEAVGDVETYNAIRAIVLDAAEDKGSAWQPNYARDRLRGAAGG